MPSSTRPALVRALALAVALVLLAAGCSEGAGLSGSPDPTERERSTTTAEATTEVVAGESLTTEVAAAKGAVVHIHTTIPDPEIAATAPASATPPVATKAAVLPIPRDGYGSAGVRKTAEGWEFDNPTYFGHPLVFVVTAEHEGWLRVMVPARPNGQQGWVDSDEVTRSTHTYRVELTLGDFTLKAYDGAEVFAETKVVIGKGTTPTPTGTFYITEALPRGQGNPGGAYGAWILPTSGYSEAMNEFDGGLPVIALHGTNNPGAIGTAVSNGCVRMPDEVISQLAERLPPGTPVIVKP